MQLRVTYKSRKEINFNNNNINHINEEPQNVEQISLHESRNLYTLRFLPYEAQHKEGAG